MDIEKEYSCLEKNSLVFQKAMDNDEDYQEAIPQYCDDIFRVVKCTAHSYITSVDTNYSEVKVFGKTQICLTYYNENSALSYVDFEEEFTKTIEVENLSENAFANVTVSDKYVNFRVINQRRIDIHSSNSLCFKIYDKVKCPCITSCNSSKLKFDNVKTASIINSSVNKVEFDEEFSIPSDSKPIKRIISSSSFVTLSETKIIKDKALVKALLSISVLYTTDENEENICKCDYSFSISKILDVGGIEENDIIIASLSIGNLYFKAKSTSNDKLCAIEVFGDLSISSVFIREENQSLITDGYILNRNSKCSYSDYSCCSNGKYCTENKLQNLTFEFSSEIKDIKELSVSVSDTMVKNGKIIVKATANIVCMTEGETFVFYSSSTNFEIDIEQYQNAISALSIQSYDYTLMSGGKIDVRLSVAYSAYLFNDSSIKVLSEIEADDDIINYPALTVYFAKENESVWNIAKSFSSDIDLILKENELNCETLDCNKVLIIPGV